MHALQSRGQSWRAKVSFKNVNTRELQPVKAVLLSKKSIRSNKHDDLNFFTGQALCQYAAERACGSEDEYTFCCNPWQQAAHWQLVSCTARRSDNSTVFHCQLSLEAGLGDPGLWGAVRPNSSPWTDLIPKEVDCQLKAPRGRFRPAPRRVGALPHRFPALSPPTQALASSFTTRS